MCSKYKAAFSVPMTRQAFGLIQGIFCLFWFGFGMINQNTGGGFLEQKGLDLFCLAFAASCPHSHITQTALQCLNGAYVKIRPFLLLF